MRTLTIDVIAVVGHHTPVLPLPSDRYPMGCLELMLTASRPTGRPQSHPLREIIDDFYVLRGGISCRALLCDYPPYRYFCAWQLDGTRERLNDQQRELVRERQRLRAQRSAAVGQDDANGPRGYDGTKYLNGASATCLSKRSAWCCAPWPLSLMLKIAKGFQVMEAITDRISTLRHL